MPQYDYRCKRCQQRFALFYKTYARYEAAAPQCPNCASRELSRLITQVAIPKSGQDYAKMSSGEMLSVLESGDARQVDEMFRQVGGAHPAAAHQMSKPESGGQDEL